MFLDLSAFNKISRGSYNSLRFLLLNSLLNTASSMAWTITSSQFEFSMYQHMYLGKYMIRLKM
jgi:hypothetical protein